MRIEISTADRVDVVDVTDEVDAGVPDGLDRGLCTVFARHTTAGIAVNEAEAGLLDDIRTLLGDLVADDAAYRHDRIDDNAAAHLRSILLGSSATVPVRAGRLDLGTWQRILLVEGDGPRSRTIDVVTTATAGGA